MIDNNEADDKIIAVAANDMSMNYIWKIEDLLSYFHSEIKNFFGEYKKLEHKKLLAEDFQDSDIAKHIIGSSIAYYQSKFKK